MSGEGLGVGRENGVVRRGVSEETVNRLVALGRALSDPIRVRMLGMMAEGRNCCDFADAGVPAGEGDEGICVCDDANEACPVFPGAKERLHWSFPDPSATTGGYRERLQAFRRVRDHIRARIEEELIQATKSL